MNSAPALQLVAVHRTYQQGGGGLHVLKGAELTIARGEVVALVGPSGAGKSTLLHIAGLLERPDAGEVRFNGQDCGNFDDEKRTELRRSRLGFVYQFHHLLPEFSAVENIIVPQMIAGVAKSVAKERAMVLLESMGLAARADHLPSRLSGGECQRVALARALVNRPAVLLADEPTGNLDERTAEEIMRLLLDVVAARGLALVLVTHSREFAERASRRLVLSGGVLSPA